MDTANQDALTQKSISILPITHFKLQLEAQQFQNVYGCKNVYGDINVYGYKNVLTKEPERNVFDKIAGEQSERN